MKNVLTLLLCLPLFLNAQIPNAGFEDWSTVNNEELPDSWNSYGLILKSNLAFQGNYAVTLASTSIYDHAAMYSTFTAPEPIQKLIGVINIDSISHGGRALITVNAWTTSGYYTLGSYSHDQVSNNYIPFDILFDLPPSPIDSLRIDVRSGPLPIPNGIAIGFSSFRLDKLQLVDSTTTTVQELDHFESIEVFPNPVDDQLQIYSKEKQIETISIYNLNGKLLLQHKTDATNNHEVNVGSLESGIYLILIKTQDGILFRKSLVKM